MDVPLVQQDQILIVNLDVYSGVFGEHDLVANLDFHGNSGAVVQNTAGAYSQDFTLLGFFFGGVRQNNAAYGLLLSADGSDDDFLTKGFDAVSYTHLDVYKRQVQILHH